MAFQKQLLPECPECKQPALRVVESRQATHGRRRRKQCDVCGHRCTIYEISSEHYARYDHFLYMHNELCKRLGQNTTEQTPPQDNQCTTCNHNQGSDCAYGFPEYDTPDSSDCTWYEQQTSI